ncbi:nitrate ABC transporter substrate-binding protein [Rhodococcus sp. 06-462-5]|uniref:ABC transporter substrate-binding protein n=1 Tax=Nocardiaceae TaxID=85025 RepID=UPI00050C61CB|nr:MULTISPECIES: ABC transporter substrate-binding protein [Rhodococcus]OZC73910.1 nitrate ABC transporter substrate-binding protein [Rhodococcus sp. 06-462-5]OZE67907.1 nitrate ABC transporter substrate-binding protein [Rhodococcus sp. 02-925g]OZF51088.1 nitrate ABC transporter substrate-binding protein [Rhodococcus sp. 14-1411-2a]
MTARRLLLPVLALATALTISTACSSSPDPEPTSSDGVDLSSVSLKVGATGWNAQEQALQVAGLDDTPYSLEFAVFSGGDQQLQALQSGALDLAQSSEIPPIFAAAGGTVKFDQIAVQTGTTLLQEVVVGGGSSIRSIAELRGKKVGYVKNTTAAYFLNELLKENGLSWSDIVPQPLTPNDGLAALNGGSIDAFASYGNTIIAAHRSGAETIGSGESILSGNFPWSVSDGVLDHPGQKAAVADLLARLDRAYAYIRDGHQQEFAERTAAATNQPVDSALAQITDGEAQNPTSFAVPTAEVESNQQKVADSLREIGALPNEVNTSELWSDGLSTELTAALAAAK